MISTIAPICAVLSVIACLLKDRPRHNVLKSTSVAEKSPAGCLWIEAAEGRLGRQLGSYSVSCCWSPGIVYLSVFRHGRAWPALHENAEPCNQANDNVT